MQRKQTTETKQTGYVKKTRWDCVKKDRPIKHFVSYDNALRMS